MSISTTPRRSTDKGFTLIELLIVIVILGILAAVVVFSVSNIRDTAAENACLTEKKTIQTAVEAYYAETATKPSSTATLVGDYLASTPTYFSLNTSGGLVNAQTPMPGSCSA